MSISRKLLVPSIMRRMVRLLSTTGSLSEQQQPLFIGRREEPLPCYTKLKEKNGPIGLKGAYGENIDGHSLFTHKDNFTFKHGGVIPSLNVAYETWGELNEDRSNAILVHTGLSASAHARSNQDNPGPGWWEKFIGPGKALDTNKFFIICSNNLGGCYGTSGPSSVNPLTGSEYAMTFPILSVEDMVHCQFLLLDHLKVERLHASVGPSLGGMQSLMAAALFPQRVGRVVTISACVRTHPSSIALRYVQRRILMSDPDWNQGRYYGNSFPRVGMQHAREVGTITYRSGPEWLERFGHQRASPDSAPDFCPDFLVETYLENQGEKFCEAYDPNSILYISKAMDMFDMGAGHSSLLEGVARVRAPVLVLGVNSDVLFPVEQQRQMATLLKEAGNNSVTYYELTSIYGHDTFLLDVNNVGAAMKGYLESEVH
ncbi:uncharacterized protein LOC135342697 [Halichondria panicea]|uniref:uncharacterized protein LOC135342697 n=1 Tax=Halichondria panicea TaxID=6063 RepID=UPI00312B5F61